VQDGPKNYYLCEACEQVLGSWEAVFAQRIFGASGKRVG
jgi:hypothetical protein